MTRPSRAPEGEGVASRSAALEVLARVEDDGAYANLALGPVLERHDLEDRDRALVTDLVYGTIRRRRSLEFLVERFLSDRPSPAAYRALLLGAYQVTYRDDIPPYAAVSATVSAAPRRFRGLVNAVLRRLSDAPPEFPDVATRLSYPDWIVERLTTDLGQDDALGALDSMNEPARTHVREDGYVQDPASQMVTEALLEHVSAPARVLDLCAAPGGKATGLAAREGIHVVAADVSEGRVQLLASNVARLACSAVSTVVADALAPPVRPASFDAVLLDAPCSGLGVLRRRADARWRIESGAPERLSALQRSMVDAAVGSLAPGGVLAYSVCTLTASETTAIDDHIASAHPGLVALEPPGEPWQSWGRGALLLPQVRDTDGMALFLYRRS